MNDGLQISDAGLALIKEFEGSSLTLYRDLNGFPTIGYGHRLKAGESFLRITPQVQDELLRQDAEEAAAAVIRLVAVRLTPGQFDAMADFVFNLGADRLRNSTLLKVLNYGDYAGACRQLYHSEGDGHITGWVFANHQVQPGLVRRRKAEQALWVS